MAGASGGATEAGADLVEGLGDLGDQEKPVGLQENKFPVEQEDILDDESETGTIAEEDAVEELDQGQLKWQTSKLVSQEEEAQETTIQPTHVDRIKQAEQASSDIDKVLEATKPSTETKTVQETATETKETTKEFKESGTGLKRQSSLQEARRRFQDYDEEERQTSAANRQAAAANRIDALIYETPEEPAPSMQVASAAQVSNTGPAMTQTVSQGRNQSSVYDPPRDVSMVEVNSAIQQTGTQRKAQTSVYDPPREVSAGEVNSAIAMQQTLSQGRAQNSVYDPPRAVSAMEVHTAMQQTGTNGRAQNSVYDPPRAVSAMKVHTVMQQTGTNGRAQNSVYDPPRDVTATEVDNAIQQASTNGRAQNSVYDPPKQLSVAEIKAAMEMNDQMNQRGRNQTSMYETPRDVSVAEVNAAIQQGGTLTRDGQTGGMESMQGTMRSVNHAHVYDNPVPMTDQSIQETQVDTVVIEEDLNGHDEAHIDENLAKFPMDVDMHNLKNGTTTNGRPATEYVNPPDVTEQHYQPLKNNRQQKFKQRLQEDYDGGTLRAQSTGRQQYNPPSAPPPDYDGSTLRAQSSGRQRLNDPSVPLDKDFPLTNKRPLPPRINSQMFCTKCQTELDLDHPIVNYNGSVWHPQCFV